MEEIFDYQLSKSFEQYTPSPRFPDIDDPSHIRDLSFSPTFKDFFEVQDSSNRKIGTDKVKLQKSKQGQDRLRYSSQKPSIKNRKLSRTNSSQRRQSIRNKYTKVSYRLWPYISTTPPSKKGQVKLQIKQSPKRLVTTVKTSPTSSKHSRGKIPQPPPPSFGKIRFLRKVKLLR